MAVVSPISLIYNKQMMIDSMCRNEHKWINRKCLLPFFLVLFIAWPIISVAAPPSPGAVRGNLPRAGGLTLPQDITHEDLVPPGEDSASEEESEQPADSEEAPSNGDTTSDQPPALSPVEE